MMKKFSLFLLFILPLLPQAEEVPFSIYHTNDLHSHFDGVKAISSEGKVVTLGGFSRLATKIKELREKKKNEIIFGVDAGDFFAGTIFSALAPSLEPDFPEYEFLTENGFELMILGNHEYDPGNIGFQRMLEKVQVAKTKIPLINTNLYVEENSPFKRYFGEKNIIQKSLIKTFQIGHEKLKVLFLGALGPNGCLVSKTTRGDFLYVGFDDKKSKQKLADLADILQGEIDKYRANVDVVLLSIHGGGDEAEELAKSLTGLDILIAGHTHREEFKIVNGVYFQQTGSYGVKLGHLEFLLNKTTKKLTLKKNSPTLIAIDQKISSDDQWDKRIAKWREKSFKLMGHSENPEEIVFTPKKSYPRSRELFNPMGLLVTSGIRAQLNQELKTKNLQPVDVYFTSMGLIRSSFEKNIPYNRADIFEAVSIGFDEKIVPGVDVVHFYITPDEMESLINFLEIYSHFTSTFSPIASSNLTYGVRWYGIPFLNRIKELKIDGKLVSEEKRLIHVATNRFVTNNIETVRLLSKGFVSIIPKDREGKPLKQLPTHSKEYKLLTNYLSENSNL